MTGDGSIAAPVIVHNLNDIRNAFLSPVTCHLSPLFLQSATDAIFYAGALYLLTMFREAKAEFPSIDAIFILDCSDAGAEAVAAMQMGHTHIRSSAPEPLRKKMCDIAGQLGVTIIADSA